jgi:methylmalonyl-CoA mutase
MPIAAPNRLAVSAARGILIAMTDTEQNVPLAADFPPARHDEWRKLAEAVLKGAAFERLTSKTYDGLAIEPLYERAANARAISGRAPSKPWTVLQRVDHPDPAAANAQALDDLENGATGLVLVFAGSLNANGYGLDTSAAALTRVLDGIHLDAGIAIDLNLSPATRGVVRDLAGLIRNRGFSPSSVDLRTSFNPVGGFAASGRRPRRWEDMSRDFAAMIGGVADAGFRGPLVVADGRVIHNAGGSEAQELAFALASAVTYLRALEAGGMPLVAARDAIYFRLSADAEQFLTMAKFGAIRRLWARVEEACGLVPKPALITAETAWRMLTKRDPHVNILRTTIAVAAAGLGGADAIVAPPHTAPLGLPDAFARRVARNIQLVLLEESNLARVTDPAAGSGALEALTEQMCTAAWLLFQEIERAGGVWAALESGVVQQKVAAVRAERQKAVAQRKDILTGSNEYPDLHETASATLNVAEVTSPTEDAPVVATPMPRIRLAEPFERLRDLSDQLLARTGARPKIFLACLGTPADFTPRASFARNFFEAGGIEAISGEGDASALGAAFTASGAALACLCASDRTYESEAANAAAALKSAGARQLYLAGRPGSREAALRSAGVQSFIYEGCDALSLLQAALGLFVSS